MKLSRPAPPRPALPLSPMIDVVFILLIFVLLVARFAAVETLGIDVPVASARQEARSDALVVHQVGAGVWRIGDVTADGPGWRDLLSAAMADHRRVVVVAAGDTPLQEVVDVVAEARRLGAQDVAIAARAP